MADRIEPALTPREWAVYREGNLTDIRYGENAVDLVPTINPSGGILLAGRNCADGVEDEDGEVVEYEDAEVVIPEGARHMVAAICLDGYAFGFTQKDVDWLRQHAISVRKSHGEADADRLLHLCAKIAALLPPERT